MFLLQRCALPFRYEKQTFIEIVIPRQTNLTAYITYFHRLDHRFFFSPILRTMQQRDGVEYSLLLLNNLYA